MAPPTVEELNEKKKQLLAEQQRQKLEAEVKALEKATKKPSLMVGVARIYVRGAKAAINGVGAMIDELNKPPAKEKKGKKPK